VKEEDDQKGNRPYPVKAGNHLNLLLQFKVRSICRSLNYSPNGLLLVVKTKKRLKYMLETV
jgi:hypothetical protein